MSVYCAADWHGCYWVWKKVKEILKPDDILCFLGDAADRGSDGWKLIKELLDDKRVIYLKGNHEDLLVQAMINRSEEAYKDTSWFNYDAPMRLWFYNGGDPTYTALVGDEDLSSIEKKHIIEKLRILPFCTVFHNKMGYDILLSHAGSHDFETANKAEEEDFLWDRNHYFDFTNWYGKDTEYIIHGHTPIEYMLKDQENSAFGERSIVINNYNGGVYWYSKGHKACLDMGTAWNDIAVLLDLNTFEEIIIKK